MTPEEIVEFMKLLQEHDHSITKILEFQIMLYQIRVLVRCEINGTLVDHHYLQYHKEYKEFTYWP